MTESSSQTGATSGMIGLGNMGGRIARRIEAAGFAVQGYDRSPSQSAASGIAIAGSIAELSADSGVVLLSLPDSPRRRGGRARRGRDPRPRARGLHVIDLTTAAPSSTVHLHAALAERGITLIDAGI